MQDTALRVDAGKRAKKNQSIDVKPDVLGDVGQVRGRWEGGLFGERKRGREEGLSTERQFACGGKEGRALYGGIPCRKRERKKERGRERGRG